jgi:malonate-semialdehyde dehydrogenase (acetylating)/methylmalonate-semialdehyde dehydrogenase
VDQLITHADVKAVSFIGSSRVGQHVCETNTAAGKRVQCMMGAKNHMVVMPDAERDATLNALVGASAGAAGRRCTAIPVAAFVGESAEWINDLAGHMAAAKPGAWDDPAAA